MEKWHVIATSIPAWVIRAVRQQRRNCAVREQLQQLDPHLVLRRTAVGIILDKQHDRAQQRLSSQNLLVAGPDTARTHGSS